jgi:TonB family protein
MFERKKRNSSKVNLVISIVFHTILIGGGLYFAARNGLLGQKLKAIAVQVVPKDKKPEPPKEKTPEPKVQQVKAEDMEKAAAAQPRAAAAAAPEDAQATVAPATVDAASFNFNDGAHDVVDAKDPITGYKGLVETTLRSHWNRPEDLEDEKFAVDVELTIDSKGTVQDYQWLEGTGNSRWDDSVKAALAKTKTINHAPPKGFPGTVRVRFDVGSAPANEVQFSVR